MLAAKKTGPARAAVLDVATPVPRPGEVLVRVRACAICASDLWGWNAEVNGPGAPGEWDADNPGLTGHEIAGEIAAVGPGIDGDRVGEAVWIDPIAGCGECEECRDGRQTFCRHVTIVSQGFAEYVVAPGRQCRPRPDGLDYVSASMIGDMAGTPISAVKRAAVSDGESIAVWGLGPVGLGLAQASLIAGARLVIGLDPVQSRRARAERLGVQTMDPGPDVVQRLQELTGGRGPDVALCSVSADGAVRAAFESLRPDGRMITVAGFPPAGGEERKWVSGSWGCDERLWPEVLDHLAARRFVFDDYVTHRFPLSRIEEAFAIRERDLEGSFKVVVVSD
jgi:threonine dehydrogenase-like Zn-dependent dehydrogenase